MIRTIGRRWERWLPWGLLALSLLILWQRTLHAHHLTTDRRQTQSLTGAILAAELQTLGRIISDADDAATRDDMTTTLTRLAEAETQAVFLDRLMGIYDSATVDQTRRRSMGPMLSLYSNTINQLASAIRTAQQIQPDHRAWLDAVVNDVKLLQELFPEPVLRAADPTALTEAMQQFCQRFQINTGEPRVPQCF